MNKIQAACKVIGGQAALARALGVSPAVVNQWVSGVRPVPIERCVAIERATAGAVTRRDLRPDDWRDIWPELVDVIATEPAASEAGQTEEGTAAEPTASEVGHG